MQKHSEGDSARRRFTIHTEIAATRSALYVRSGSSGFFRGCLAYSTHFNAMWFLIVV